MSETQKSGDNPSGFNIRTHVSAKVEQDQISGGLSVLCWPATPARQMVYGNLVQFLKNSVIRSSSVKRPQLKLYLINGACHCMWSLPRMARSIRISGIKKITLRVWLADLLFYAIVGDIRRQVYAQADQRRSLTHIIPFDFNLLALYNITFQCFTILSLTKDYCSPVGMEAHDHQNMQFF